jgi:AraC-like DNA-binding protein
MGVLQAHALTLNQVKNYNSLSTLKYISVAEYWYDKDRETIDAFSHKHEEYEFIIPMETIPLLIYDKANYIGEVGYIYPVNPMTEHGIAFPLNKSGCIDITVSKEYVDDLKAKLGFDSKYFFTRFIMPSTFLDVLREFQREVDKVQYNSFKAESLAKLLVSTLIIEGLTLGVDNRRPEKKYKKNIKQMILYMYNNFNNQELDIADLAKMSGYSLTYFTKAFKAYMNDTPIMHLNKLRISEARSLMNKGVYNFYNIYHEVGYKNLSSFTEAFKRITGMTPSKYRTTYVSR